MSDGVEQNKTRDAVDVLSDAVTLQGDVHRYEPRSIQIGKHMVAVDIVTDGTHRGTIVKDHNTGKLIAAGRIAFDMNFDRKAGGNNLFDLRVVGACAINNVPAQVSYTVIHGCPNPDCHYHTAGVVEQLEEHSRLELGPELGVLALRIAGAQKALQQAKNRVWEIQWARESLEGEILATKEEEFSADILTFLEKSRELSREARELL